MWDEKATQREQQQILNDYNWHQIFYWQTAFPNIQTHTGRSKKILSGRGVSKTKVFTGRFEAKLEFTESRIKLLQIRISNGKFLFLVLIVVFHFLTLIFFYFYFFTEKEESDILPPLQESKFGDKNFIKE